MWHAQVHAQGKGICIHVLVTAILVLHCVPVFSMTSPVSTMAKHLAMSMIIHWIHNNRDILSGSRHGHVDDYTLDSE